MQVTAEPASLCLAGLHQPLAALGELIDQPGRVDGRAGMRCQVGQQLPISPGQGGLAAARLDRIVNELIGAARPESDPFPRPGATVHRVNDRIRCHVSVTP